MGELDLFLAGVERQSTQDQLRENGARTANFSMKYITTGDGDLISQEVSVFGCTFTGVPIVTSSSILLHAPDPLQFSLPRVNAGVYGWVTHKSPAGLLYTGCYLYFTVDVQDLNGSIVSLNDTPCVIEHHIRFDGIALKALPDTIVNVS